MLTARFAIYLCPGVPLEFEVCLVVVRFEGLRLAEQMGGDVGVQSVRGVFGRGSELLERINEGEQGAGG